MLSSPVPPANIKIKLGSKFENMFALVFKVELLCTLLRPSVFDKFSRTCLTFLPETWFKCRPS